MGRETKHIEWSEVTRLVDSLKKDNNRIHLLITIQSMLGLRVGDVLSLKWSDFDSEELCITERKTKKVKRMIINDSLRTIVHEEYNKKFKNKKKDLIFLNKLGTSSISISYVNTSLKKAFKKYDVKSDQVSSHIFRKSFCYKILEDGDFSDKAIFLVSRLLNHSSIATTMKYLLLDQREADNIYLNLKL